MGAGGLIERVEFSKPHRVEDGQGGWEDGWEPQFTCRAEYTRLRGSETVQAARLSGRQPTVIKVRASSETKAVKTNWLITDKRTGEEFNIRSREITKDRQYVEFLAESGVAV